MRFRNNIFFSVLALVLVLSACAPVKAEEAMKDKPTQAVMMDKPTQVEMMDKPTEAEMMDEAATPEAMKDKPADAAMMDGTATPAAMLDKPTDDMMMETPAWFGVSLTNVNSGETFTINDYAGKVVLVETLAQWCSTCKKQQMEIKALIEQLGPQTDLVVIGLDIDPNENEETLMSYIANNRFDWIYAVAPQDVSREIGKLYGDQFLNPPSAPILVIDRKGEVHVLAFGIKSTDDLMKVLEPYLIGM